MSTSENIRLYYKSQKDLGQAIKGFIDLYFEDKVHDDELEEKILSVISANMEKFYIEGTNEIAVKPKHILGKARMEVLNKILQKNRGIAK